MTIKPQRYRVAFVFNTLYYPFIYPEVLDALKTRGYTRLVPPQQPQGGARIYISGPAVATKAGCFIELNENKKIMACEGTDVNSIISSVKDIIEMSRVDFKLNIPNDITYIEFSGWLVVFNDNSPDAIKQFSGDQYRIFDSILGEESAGGTIRIIPKIGSQMDKKWFDITIAQKVPAIENEYFVEIVFRNGNDVESMLGFLLSLEEKISAIINKIGGR